MNNKPKTIFCDLDGTLIKHCNPVEIQDPNLILEVLEGTHDKLREWDNKVPDILQLNNYRMLVYFMTI